MTKYKFMSRRSRFQALALTAALALPAAIGGSVWANETVVAEVPVAEELEFAESFAVLPEPTNEFDTPAGAVDITEIEIPIEVEPEPTVRTLGNGMASYYGKRFNGRLTANGERFNMNAMTAAHKTLPFGTKVRVTNPRNGKTVTVRINDRGPYIRGRTIDLSRAAAQKIGLIQRGHGKVEMELIES